MADVKSRSLQRVLALLAAVLTLSGAKAETGALNDPVAYCKATGTIDAPDAKYKGSAVPDWMVAKAYPPERDQGAERRRHGSEEGDRLALRVGRRADVRARPQCGKASTNKTPTKAMQNYCVAETPSADVIPLYVIGHETPMTYDWGCHGKEPIIKRPGIQG
jgi:hypothetical protein